MEKDMEHYEGIVLKRDPRISRKRIILGGTVLVLMGFGSYCAISLDARVFLGKQVGLVTRSLAGAFGLSDDEGVMAGALDLAGGIADAQGDSVSSSSTASIRSSKTTSKSKKGKGTSGASPPIPKKDVPTAPNTDENGLPIMAGVAVASSAPKADASSLGSSSAVSFRQAPPVSGIEYGLQVSLSGDGRGIVTSSPPGITCGSTCFWNFASGSVVRLHATADTASLFGGWTGGCSGLGNECAITVGGYVSVGASFRGTQFSVPFSSTPSIPSRASSSELGDVGDGGGSSSGGGVASSSVTASSSAATGASSSIAGMPDSSSTPNVTPKHVLIAAIQVAGTASGNDFVRIFNPLPDPVDVTAWRLRKRSSTGTDYSLKEFPKGSILVGGGYFTWANSANGFAGSINADVSSSETISADNSVALVDASGTVISAVAWGKGANQYEEGSPYPANPTANQVLLRRSVSGMPADNGDNATDFGLQ